MIYLVRHGQAKLEQEDPQRSLTDSGRRAVEKLAAFLKPKGLEVDIIWHSGKARAAQTAEIIATAVKSKKGVVQRKDLSPNDPVDNLVFELNAADKDLMLVGHLPFMSRLLSAMTAKMPHKDIAGFRESTIVCLETDCDNNWLVSWMVHPDVL